MNLVCTSYQIKERTKIFCKSMAARGKRNDQCDNLSSLFRLTCGYASFKERTGINIPRGRFRSACSFDVLCAICRCDLKT